MKILACLLGLHIWHNFMIVNADKSFYNMRSCKRCDRLEKRDSGKLNSWRRVYNNEQVK